MEQIDFVVIGGGIAGLSCAARLAAHGRVAVLEAESGPGYHASGRSVAFAHFGLGEQCVRALTALSLRALADFGMRHPALHIASAAQVPALDALEAVHHQFSCDYARLSGEHAQSLMPVLRVGWEHCHAALVDYGALKLDTDAMLQAHMATLRSGGGALIAGARVSAIARIGRRWRVETAARAFTAPIVVNAAGA